MYVVACHVCMYIYMYIKGPTAVILADLATALEDAGVFFEVILGGGKRSWGPKSGRGEGVGLQ